MYPDEYADFLSRLTLINLNFGFLVSYGCLMETDFFDRLLLTTLAPLVVLGVLAASYSAVKAWITSSQSSLSMIRNIYLSTALFIMFFVYSSVSFTVFQTFACDTLDNGIAYLRADYSLTCFTKRHDRYKLYALIMVCVYPVGIPAVFAWIIASNRLDLMQHNRDPIAQLEPLRGLWAAYKPSKYYYEVVECIRRVSFTGIAVFVLPNSPAQIAFELLLAVFFTYVSESLSPFESMIDMCLYRWGNGVIFSSMYVALLLKVDVSQEGTEALSAYTGVLIAANVFMIVAVVIQSVLLIIGWRGVTPRTIVDSRFGGQRMGTSLLHVDIFNANRRRRCKMAVADFRNSSSLESPAP